MAHFQVECLCKSFGGLKAVDQVSFQIEQGAIHGLIGPNGAGKTTLFNCISGIYKPNEGKVIFAGHDLTALKSPHQIAHVGVARTFQNIELFGQMTALENLLVGQHAHMRSGVFDSALRLLRVRREEDASRQKAQGILRFLGLEAIQDYPARYMSFGHQKLLELGRALALTPQMLLLDEPDIRDEQPGNHGAAALDRGHSYPHGHYGPAGRARYGPGHEVVRDRNSILNFGVKIADGTPSEIQNNPEVIEAYLGEGASIAED